MIWHNNIMMDKKRISIGICDDKQEAIFELQKYIEENMQRRKEDWEIRSFSSGGELLQKIEELSIVFLDIEMPELDGIETGREILKRNPDCKIIMATGMVGRFKEAFQIRAVRFVTKPFVKEEVEEALDAALSKVWEQKTIKLSRNRISYQIYQREITYVRAFNGYTEYAVNGQWMRKEITLEEAEKLLDSKIFAQISRQFIVNLAYVQNYKDGVLWLDNKKFQVSRRMKKKFEQTYIEYDLRYR